MRARHRARRRGPPRRGRGGREGRPGTRAATDRLSGHLATARAPAPHERAGPMVSESSARGAPVAWKPAPEWRNPEYASALGADGGNTSCGFESHLGHSSSPGRPDVHIRRAPISPAAPPFARRRSTVGRPSDLVLGKWIVKIQNLRSPTPFSLATPAARPTVEAMSRILVAEDDADVAVAVLP